MVLASVYLSLAALYLFILPAATYSYLQARWYQTSGIERLFMFALVFLLFPGMLLLSPFLNYRPKRRHPTAPK